MINEVGLKPYASHYISPSKCEKVGSVRTFFKIADKFNPSWSEAGQSMYSYLRILDNYIDETPSIIPALRLISSERKNLLEEDRPSTLQEEYLEKPLLQLFKGTNKEKVRIYLDKILSGMMSDANIRYSQKPLRETQLKARNFRVTYYPFSTFFMAILNKEVKPTPAIVDMINNLATYDNISDIFEDLPRGLILISKEDLNKYNLSFQDGQPLPTENLLKYNRVKRGETRLKLRTSSSQFFHLGLPVWLAATMYLYTYTRSMKLFIPLPREEGLIYTPPLDSIKPMGKYPLT